jgi:hypothetical protein
VQRDFQRIKEQLGDAESKLKDAQLQRLQEKVKGFAQTEKALRMQIGEIERRDESLISKLETAVCFGKIMISQRPIRVKAFGELLSEVKYQAVDLPLQRQLNEGTDGGGVGSLPERVDDCIAMGLEVEFNDIYNIVKNPNALREFSFSSRFALVTPDQQLVLYGDVHMTQEHRRYQLAHTDFLDMGILIQNNL